jgi:hypothetical protein
MTVVAAAVTGDDEEMDVIPLTHGQFCRFWHQTKGKTMLFPMVWAAAI